LRIINLAAVQPLPQLTDLSLPRITEDPLPPLDEPQVKRWKAAWRLVFLVAAAVLCWVAAIGGGWIIWRLATS
jgi:hypothetical protein